MPPSNHARLSASSAHRWLECPPSVVATEHLPDETSIFAEEGSAAHEAAEYKVRWYLGERDMKPPSTGQFDADEIDRHTDTYAFYAADKIEEIRKSCPDAIVLVEQRLDFSNYVEDGFGTGDLVIVADDVIHVIDFKYGKGVPVSAEHNPQMMLYALGALNLYDYLYDIHTVKMSIVQPRLDSISEWEISVEDLKEWAENTLKPVAELAAKGEGEFKAGSHCRFCKLTRMTPETREKLRKAHLNTGEGKTYTKLYGMHEHRVVAENQLGRPLKKGEVVHHVDGDCRNNNPDNILVLPSQKEHAALHARLNRFFA